MSSGSGKDKDGGRKQHDRTVPVHEDFLSEFQRRNEYPLPDAQTQDGGLTVRSKG